MKLSSQKAKNTSFTLEFLASLTKSTLIGDASLLIDGVDSLDCTSLSKISFLSHLRYKHLLGSSKVGAIIVPQDYNISDSKNYLVSDNPSKAIQKILHLFNKDKEHQPYKHPDAIISSKATISSTARIEAGCVIENGVEIGAETIIMANSYIGKNVTIGSNCLLHPNVVIQNNCILGENIVIQSGTVVGSCGYGYFTNEKGKHEKIEHFGNVILEDEVEIGANTTIDRARFNSTIIGKGTKIDNLVQIAHNVILGQDNLIVSQCGVSGSTTTGNRVILGGQTGIVGHIHITDDVILAAKGGFSKNINEKGIYSGAPAQPIQQYNKNYVLLRDINRPIKRIKNLEEKITLLEKKLASLENSSDSH